MQNLSTLEEAAGELSTLTGKAWTTAKLLDYCAQNLISLLAQVIIEAKDIDELLLRHPKAMTWISGDTWRTYATVLPEALWVLQQSGIATTRHPADGPRSWPVRNLPVSVEKVRVDVETLQRIVQGFEQAATPEPDTAPETKEQREDRYLQACIDAGLVMPTSSLRRLPDGIGKVAKTLGIERQSLAGPVKAALKRRESAKKEGVIVRF